MVLSKIPSICSFIICLIDAVSNTPKRAAGHYSGSTAPIPQKATLARSASRSRSKDTSPRDEIIDIDFDDNPLRSPDSDDDLDSAVSINVIKCINKPSLSFFLSQYHFKYSVHCYKGELQFLKC